MLQAIHSELDNFKSLLLAPDSENRKYYRPDLHDDKTLERFLSARPGNIEEAVLMFNNWQEWRDKENVDSIHLERFDKAQEIHDLYPRFFHRVDKLGRPVWIKRHSNFDFASLVQITGPMWQSEFIRHHIRENEKLMQYRLPACSMAADRHVSQVVLIMDLHGFPLMTLPKLYSTLAAICQIDADYYPESLGRIIVVNAGLMFSGFWKVIKGFLPAVTVEKVNILGSSYQKELLDLIDTENLPDFLGGSCKCDHIEGGCVNSDDGPWNNGSTAPHYPQQKWEDLELKPVIISPKPAV